MNYEFHLKDLGSLSYFIGLEVGSLEHKISLSQRHYTLKILEDTGFLGCKPHLIPMEPNLKLNNQDGNLLSENIEYKQIIGRLLYLTITHPDIIVDVHKFNQFVFQP